MKKIILQKIANYIFNVLEKTNDLKIFGRIYDMAIWFDGWCINKHGYYLD